MLINTKNSPNGDVKYDCNDGVGYIEFYHPSSNSLPGAILNKLAETIDAADKDRDAKVIVMASSDYKENAPFCAGASFDELLQITDFETGKEFFSGFARVINAMRKSSKFVVLQVQGKAVGGGVGLCAAADYVFAVDSAAIKLSELALGIGPFVVGPAVERKVGTAAYSQLSIDYDSWYNSDWALDRGLFAKVLPGKGLMQRESMAFASKLAQGSPEAMAEMKRVLWQGTEHWDTLLFERAEISGRLVLSDFTKEFINRFKNN